MKRSIPVALLGMGLWLTGMLSPGDWGLVSRASAQDAERTLCVDDQPGPDCTDDTLEVVFPTFGAKDNFHFQYADFVAGTTVDMRVVMGAVSDRIQGWSYGVTHDSAILEIDPASVTTDGTIAADLLLKDAFNQTFVVDGGFVSGIILSLGEEDVLLPTGRQTIARARYSLVADAGIEGTRLRIADEEIGPPNSPKTVVSVVVSGKSLLPRTVVDGVIQRVEAPMEICTNGVDDDGDGLVDGDDPDCFDCECLPPTGVCEAFAFYFEDDTSVEVADVRGQLSFTITARNESPLLGFQFGVEINPEDGNFLYDFSNDVGTDEERLIEVLMTDNMGDSVFPERPNTLLADRDVVESIVRGDALDGFVGDDFLEFDLQPGAGAPGFTVGYASDLQDNVNQIPVTGPETKDGCPLNELLVVRLGAGECPNYAYYFQNAAVLGAVDVRGEASFSVSTRNVSPLLGFQLGVSTREDNDGVRYEFSGDLGIDEDRTIELLMTDDMGDSIVPATPNHLIASTENVVDIRRGAATETFTGDFLEFDLHPGVGGSGFLVGYVSDLDGNENMIPATLGDCSVNEVLVVSLAVDVACADFGYYFGEQATGETVDLPSTEATALISGRNLRPLLGFQLGVAITPDGDEFRYTFSSMLGTDEDRLIELLMTDNLGDSIEAAAVNQMLARTGTVFAVTRGEATQDFNGDFLDVDLDPGVGSPGFFAGYVTDLDDDANQIPATPEGDEQSCPLNELLVVRFESDVDCADFGLAFGPVPTTGTVNFRDESRFSITCRNVSPLLGVQGGVTTRQDGDDVRYAFSSDLGTDEDRLLELLMTDNQGDSIVPRAINELLASTGDVVSVVRGAAIEDFAGEDFLEVDLDPGIGGPGFFFGYVADLLDDNQIPATGPEGETCPVNELFIVNLPGGGNQPFFRGDADGNGRINVSDAVIIIQTIILNFDPPRFQCEDLLDTDNNEELNVIDALPLLAYTFQRGGLLDDPFFKCGLDTQPPGVDDMLACQESNCTP